MKTIRKRTLRVPTMTCESCERTISNTLGNIDGMESVKTRRPDSTVDISYDIRKTSLDDIKAALRETGHDSASGFIGRLWDGFIGFSERNGRDGMNSLPAGCCADPEAARKIRKGAE